MKLLKSAKYIVLAGILTTNISYASSNVFTNMDHAQGFINQSVNNREELIEFDITDRSQISAILEDWKYNLEEPIKEVIEENDYLNYNHSKKEYGYKGTSNKLTISYKIFYRTTEEEEEFIQNEVKRIIEETIDNDMTEIEKIKAINDYIVLSTEYSSATNGSPHTAYTVLHEGKGVCQGYTLLTYLLLDEINIENKIIEGKTDTGELHSWNLVKIKDEWYHLDTTFNDPVPDRKGKVSKEFLLKDDEFMKKTRSWEYNNYPKAINSNYDHLKDYKISTEDILNDKSDADILYENTDGSYSKWAEKELAESVKNKVITENTSFNMQENITREEFAEVIVNLREVITKEKYTTEKESEFIDTDNKSVIIANELGIVNGKEKNKFMPKDEVKREEMAVMFNRLLNELEINTPVTLEYIYFADEDEISNWAKGSVHIMNKLGVINGVGESIINPKGNASKEQAIIMSKRLLDIVEKYN